MLVMRGGLVYKNSHYTYDLYIFLCVCCTSIRVMLMDWQSGSSKGVPALQGWSPEFKYQFRQQKKEKSYVKNFVKAECGGTCL
jgi:hypothetical protein